MSASNSTRLERLERHVPTLPWLTLTEDGDDRDLFRVSMMRNLPAGVRNGDEFRRSDFPALERRYNLLIVSWRPAGADRSDWDGDNVISLDWGDGDDLGDDVV